MIIKDLYAYIDGEKVLCGEVKELSDRTIVTYKKEYFSAAKEKVEILKDAFAKKVGDSGYYLGGNYTMRYSAYLTYFKEREDFCYTEQVYLMKTFGYNCDGTCFLAVMTGMPGDASINVEKQGDTYRIYLLYDLTKFTIYEDIVVALILAAYIVIACKEVCKLTEACTFLKADTAIVALKTTIGSLKALITHIFNLKTRGSKAACGYIVKVDSLRAIYVKTDLIFFVVGAIGLGVCALKDYSFKLYVVNSVYENHRTVCRAIRKLKHCGSTAYKPCV